jgi:hypothetical protein
LCVKGGVVAGFKAWLALLGHAAEGVEEGLAGDGHAGDAVFIGLFFGLDDALQAVYEGDGVDGVRGPLFAGGGPVLGDGGGGRRKKVVRRCVGRRIERGGRVLKGDGRMGGVNACWIPASGAVIGAAHRGESAEVVVFVYLVVAVDVPGPFGLAVFVLVPGMGHVPEGVDDVRDVGGHGSVVGVFNGVAAGLGVVRGVARGIGDGFEVAVLMVVEGPFGVRAALDEHGQGQQVARAVGVSGGPAPEGGAARVFDFDADGPVYDVVRLIGLVVADGGVDVVRGAVVGAVDVLGDVAVGVIGGVLLGRGLVESKETGFSF